MMCLDNEKRPDKDIQSSSRIFIFITDEESDHDIDDTSQISNDITPDNVFDAASHTESDATSVNTEPNKESKRPIRLKLKMKEIDKQFICSDERRILLTDHLN